MARSPAVKHTRVCRIDRVTTLADFEGRCLALHFTVTGLSRRTPSADPGHVPSFEGDVAWFLMEQRNKTRLGYVFLHQVEKPGHWK